MSGTIAAPTGADVSSASSSATTTTSPTTQPSTTTTKPQSAGKPSRNSITKSLKAKRAEKEKTEPATADVVDANLQPAGALGADEAGKKPEGETANPEAGKGDEKPKGNGDGDLPPWMRERLGKEKGRREKLEADLSASKTTEGKLRHVVDVAVKENERLTGMLAKAGLLDERGEELQALKVQQAAKEKFATIDQQAQEAVSKSRNDEQIKALAGEMKAACEAACVEYPLVSLAELKASLRENPRADVREVARAKHEQRMAFKGKQAPTSALTTAPTTVGKPTGTSRNLPPLSAKGMAQAVKSARARG